MGKIVIYSASAPVRTALLELLPEAKGFADAYAASQAAGEADVLVADLAPAEPAGWLDEINIPVVPLISEKRDIAQAFLKPCRWREVLRRVAGHLAQAASSFAVGPFVVDPVERVLLSEDGAEAARLTEKEAQLLLLLAREGPVSRQRILDAVWGYREGLETHTLETHIYRLRQKLGDDAANPRILLTTEGGYSLAE